MLGAFLRGELHVPTLALRQMIAHAYDCYPYEACGLLVGDATARRAVRFVPTTNVAASARIYTIDAKEHLVAERAAEADGLEIIGVVHSHTHSEPYPSPTDVAQAPDPEWSYIIVSLKRGLPETRSYRLVNGTIAEETLVPV